MVAAVVGGEEGVVARMLVKTTLCDSPSCPETWVEKKKRWRQTTRWVAWYDRDRRYLLNSVAARQKSLELENIY